MKYEVCLYIVKDKLYNQIENSSRVNYNIRSLCHLVKNQRATARATTICWQPRRNSQVTKKKKILYHLLAWKILPFYYFCFYKILIHNHLQSQCYLSGNGCDPSCSYKYFLRFLSKAYNKSRHIQ